ncbi:MAG: acetyl-CoA carboxylase biotin carboxyl carrier protein [Chloroflexi bacterium]|nr:acetyl-CoA carboxylase biotin carboxyl carrier protein [Chloroflexota bacterium]
MTDEAGAIRDPGQPEEDAPSTATEDVAGAHAGPGGVGGTSASDVETLIALIDRLEPLLERSGLAELEVGTGDTTIVLRAPSALVRDPAVAAPVSASGSAAGGPSAGQAAAIAGVSGAEEPHSRLRPIVAPLTGVFYLSPSPGAAPYVKVGSEVIAGQVIGLLEAMKLFNEIRSDVTGVVRRITAEHGALVKTRQTLIEVEPT